MSEPTTPVQRLTRRRAYIGQAVVVADRDDRPLAAGHLRAWGPQILRVQTDKGSRDFATAAVRVWTRA